MAIEFMTAAMDSKLPAIPRYVLLIMANYSNKEGYAVYPSVATIAAKTGLSERTVQRCIRELEAAGILTKEGTTRAGCNDYSINMKALEGVTDSHPQDGRGDTQTPPRCQADTPTVTDSHPRGDTQTPDPLINQVTNPLLKPIDEQYKKLWEFVKGQMKAQIHFIEYRDMVEPSIVARVNETNKEMEIYIPATQPAAHLFKKWQWNIDTITRPQLGEGWKITYTMPRIGSFTYGKIQI